MYLSKPSTSPAKLAHQTAAPAPSQPPLSTNTAPPAIGRVPSGETCAVHKTGGCSTQNCRQQPDPTTKIRPATSSALGHYGSDAAPPPEREVPSPASTESAEEQAPDQTALASESRAPISRAQIRRPLSANIGPSHSVSRTTVTFTRFGPSFGMSSTPRPMHQHSFLRSRDALSR